MNGTGRVALGSLIGAALAGLIAPLVKPLFSVPTGGVGAITVHGYPKGWDYAVVALLVLGAFAGGAVFAWRAQQREMAPPRTTPRGVWPAAIVVFVLMLFIHDHPYAHMDHFHEGEHLTAGWLMKSGSKPYGDFFIFHGLATDAGLDALVLGDPPSPRRPRRLQTILDAATLALLVPIAAELTVSTAGLLAGVLASLCACAAFWIPVFPYYRLGPVFLAILGLLHYARSGRAGPLLLAFAASSLGVLWSLDTGMFALTGTAAVVVAMRIFKLETNHVSLGRVLALAVFALAMPLLVLIAVGADLGRFWTDSFVVMPAAIDPVWSLPAPSPFSANGLRYYLPLPLYGLLLALALRAWKRGETLLAAQMGTIAVFSVLLFRTAAGRVSWSHTRFAMPLLGIAVVAFILEPLLGAPASRRLAWRRLAATAWAAALIFYFEIPQNLAAGTNLLAKWRARQSHEGLVPYPFATGKGVYTGEQNARELAALNGMIATLGPPEATILDFSNERALYYLLQRKPAIRCMEISMLSVPRLLSEAMAELEANPPLCVIVAGDPAIAAFDGISNRDRVPELARWIDANYPNRYQIGRFTLATR